MEWSDTKSEDYYFSFHVYDAMLDMTQQKAVLYSSVPIKPTVAAFIVCFSQPLLHRYCHQNGLLLLLPPPLESLYLHIDHHRLLH